MDYSEALESISELLTKLAESPYANMLIRYLKARKYVLMEKCSTDNPADVQRSQGRYAEIDEFLVELEQKQKEQEASDE